MKTNLQASLASFLLCAVLSQPGNLHAAGTFRPPAVPLIVHNSYFSVWALNENLGNAEICHWSLAPNPMTCLLRVDGKTFRIMGETKSTLPALEQKSLSVDPTRTTYHFANSEIEVQMSFLSPVLADDPKLLGRPVSFVEWKIRSLDGKAKNVEIYFDIEPQIAVMDATEEARFQRVINPDFEFLRVGSLEQRVLGYRGDKAPLGWGYCYLALPKSECQASGFGPAAAMREAFALGKFSGTTFNDPGPFRPAIRQSAMAVAMNFGAVGSEPVERKLMVGYDSSPELQYFGRQMESYWKNETDSFEELLKRCWTEHDDVSARCADFDSRLKADALKAGGEPYARLVSLLYRQIIGAHHLTRDEGGHPLLFSRENASNSSVDTVDVSFPASPFFLFHSTGLLKSLLVPILNYASNPEWTHDSAPHSIGTFPQATGQRYGGKNSPMPVEETGNMLLMMAAVCKMEKSADFANRYRDLLDKWGSYLSVNGYNTGEQLCTDDFRGRQLHNTNLSLKGICGLAAYAQMLELMGEKDKAKQYANQAKEWAAQWEKEALAPDGTHFVQAFDKPESWSIKYNLIWDKLLGLGLFSLDSYRKEFDFYRSKLEKYGVPMDHRDKKSKFDWNFWAACFAGSREERDLLLDPLYRMVDETPTRLPLTDYYDTRTGAIAEFYARSVLGAIWLPLLMDEAVQNSQMSRIAPNLSEWAPEPPREQVETIIPLGAPGWSHTFVTPGKGWEKPGGSDAGWTIAPLPLGTRVAKDNKGETPWPPDKSEVWLRKKFPKPQLKPGKIRLLAFYQDEFEVFLNGRKIYETGPGTSAETPFARIERIIPTTLGAADFQEENVMAIHSRCLRKNPFLNFGMEEVSK